MIDHQAYTVKHIHQFVATLFHDLPRADTFVSTKFCESRIPMYLYKGILCDFFIFTLEQIIVLNK